MAGNFVIISRDAKNLRLDIRVTDAAGNTVASYGSVRLMLGQNPGTTPASPGHSMGKEIKLRETKGCDDSDNTKYCIMLRSEWYDNPLTSDPET